MKRNGVNQPEHYYMHCKLCNRFLKKMLALACAKVTTTNLEVQTSNQTRVKTFSTGRLQQLLPTETGGH